ncbi:phosphonate C-P lyase system protein PhnH [Vibrio brasiliensis]|uniref:phosphonate C-P lyase system protein PhnH n=1 Tax=Vibrio brasiliensis TaxID=170652 RepID=UPI001EFE7942|nr:phosphonate C-P lyase system protein PhnH [Vibrio brasiliensis]MCG9752514.1 phosphonate C-P lyase system protein PhnH [Vibrio brasiliensis]
MNTITTAFSDAVHDSQHCFRRLLTALSEPGKLTTLDRCLGFSPMHGAATQTLLTLADNTTQLWLSSSYASQKNLIENLRFHCGVSIEPAQQKASFAVIAEQDLAEFSWGDATFSPGNEEYPDSSTTVIVELNALSIASESTVSQVLRLTGPGIKTHVEIESSSMPASLMTFLEQRQERYAFPRGIDLLLVSGETLLAIPRTTKIEVTACTSQ